MQPRLLLLCSLALPAALPAQRTAGGIATAAATIPTATATALAADAIQVAWTPVSNATQYRVLRAVDPNGPFAPIGVLPGNQLGLRDAGLVPGTAFHYRIEAIVSSATIASSQNPMPLTVLTARAITAAGPALTGLQRCATVTSDCLITWQPVPGAVGYAVYAQVWTLGGCPFQRRYFVATTTTGSKGTGPCREAYQVAPVFAMKDFPVPGSTFYAEGARAHVVP